MKILADKARTALLSAQEERQEIKEFFDDQGEMLSFTTPADFFKAIGIDHTTFKNIK